MDSHDIENYFRQHRKMLAVIFLMIGMLSVSGFFMGMLQTEKQTSQRYDTPHRTDAAAVPSAEDIPTAPKYGEIPKDMAIKELAEIYDLGVDSIEKIVKTRAKKGAYPL